jgi:hypothetical protein
MHVLFHAISPFCARSWHFDCTINDRFISSLHVFDAIQKAPDLQGETELNVAIVWMPACVAKIPFRKLQRGPNTSLL